MPSEADIRMRVDAELRDLIQSGALLPAMPVPVAALARRWRVSETPVREAAWRAVGEGRLIPNPRGGFRMWDPTAGSLRAHYECLAMLVIDAIDLVDRVQLQEIAALEVREDRERTERDAIQLILGIVRSNGNDALRLTIEQILDRLVPFRRAERVLIADAFHEEADLAAALRSGSRAACRKQIRRYFGRRRTQASAVLGVIEEWRRSGPSASFGDPTDLSPN